MDDIVGILQGGPSVVKQTQRRACGGQPWTFDGAVEWHSSMGKGTLCVRTPTPANTPDCRTEYMGFGLRVLQRRGRRYWVTMWAAGQQSLPLPLSQLLISFFLRWTPNTLPSGDKYIFPPSLFLTHACSSDLFFLFVSHSLTLFVLVSCASCVFSHSSFCSVFIILHHIYPSHDFTHFNFSPVLTLSSIPITPFGIIHGSTNH